MTVNTLDRHSASEVFPPSLDPVPAFAAEEGLCGAGALVAGTWVRCQRERPAAGVWHRYAGRTGRIVVVNDEDHEFGVRFTAATAESATWFSHDELIAIDRPKGSPSIRTRVER